MTKTTFATAEQSGAARDTWHIVDASKYRLGRMSTRIAEVLMGKHRPLYTPHLGVGESVVVINASHVQLTGGKRETRVYTRYTGWMGGLRKKSLGDYVEQKPEELIKLAVRRMLPKNKSGRRMLTHLKVYAGAEHPHAAQNPQPLELPTV